MIHQQSGFSTEKNISRMALPTACRNPEYNHVGSQINRAAYVKCRDDFKARRKSGILWSIWTGLALTQSKARLAALGSKWSAELPPSTIAAELPPSVFPLQISYLMMEVKQKDMLYLIHVIIPYHSLVLCTILSKIIWKSHYVQALFDLPAPLPLIWDRPPEFIPD